MREDVKEQLIVLILYCKIKKKVSLLKEEIKLLFVTLYTSRHMMLMPQNQLCPT